VSVTSLALDFTIQTVSPLRVPVLQASMAGGGPLLPGSAVKGAARRSAAAIAALLGLPRCQQDGDPQCPLCRLFGAAGVAGAVHWSAAAVTGEDESARWPDLLDARRRQPVDRALGLSAGPPLATRLGFPAGSRLHASLHGWLAGDGRADAALLAAALLRLTYLGGGNAAGFGRVSVSVGGLRLAGEAQDVDALLDSMLSGEVV
jgi:CRISPR/Cas system CSM-associated protein Csm3 (group 7 of RAMP superfamily)